MTVDETNKMIKDCDRSIYDSYREMKKEANSMTIAAYDAASDVKRSIVESDGISVLQKTGAIVIITIFACVFLCVVEHYGWAFLVAVGGLVLAYNVNQMLTADSRKRTERADNMLLNVHQQQDILREVLEKNSGI